MADEQSIRLKGTQKELADMLPQLINIYQLLEDRSVGNMYCIPTTTFQDQFKFAPQVKLVFYEYIKEDGRKRKFDAEITFKLTNETEKTITETKAKALAEKIKTRFVTGSTFVMHKGKLIVTYLDKKKGYDFRLRVISEQEARRIIEQVMDIQNHSPEWERLVVHESKASFPEITDREMIYGELRRLPRRRPVRNVPFKYAELHVWGIPYAISLIDTTGYRAVPLVV